MPKGLPAPSLLGIKKWLYHNKCRFKRRA
jgi:hypothetical protein